MTTTLVVPADAANAAPRAAVATAVIAGTLAAAATAANVGHDPVGPDALSMLRGAAVASYSLVGAYTWWHRPSSRLGVRLTQVGVAYSLAALAASNVSLVHSTGRVFHAAWIVALAYIFLCFPGDRLGSTAERRLIAVMAAATAVVWALAIPIVHTLPSGGPLAACNGDCPENAFHVSHAGDTFTTGLTIAVQAVTASCLIGVALVLLRKSRSPTRLRRRLVEPILACAAALAASYAGFAVLRELGLNTDFFRATGVVAALAIPPALLVGQVRGRVFAAARLGTLVARVGSTRVTPQRVEALLRDATGDPSLVAVLAVPGGWVDVRGDAAELPTPAADREITYVRNDGRAVLALVHDSAAGADDELMAGVGATALMLLENARLVEELRASRARIVASAHSERLRLERNLHDGAQQRLFAVQLKLRTAREHADGDLALELDDIAADAADAVEELRSLAHGLYPTLLRERGLADALRAVARGAGIPIRVVVVEVRRLPEEIEEAVYYSVLEAIQNVAKHAGLDAQTTVTLEQGDRELVFAVVDDGDGFDLRTRGRHGIGLESIGDRIGAIGGDVEIQSVRGSGTSVRGRIPYLPSLRPAG